MKRWQRAIQIEFFKGNYTTKSELFINQKCPYHYNLMSKDICLNQEKDCDQCWDTEI
jgi:hypothetical protein